MLIRGALNPQEGTLMARNSDRLSIKETAKFFGVSTRTVKTWRKARRAPIHYRDPSGRIVFRSTDLWYFTWMGGPECLKRDGLL